MDPFLQQMMHDLQFGTDAERIEKCTIKDIVIRGQEELLSPDHPLLGPNSSNRVIIHSGASTAFRSGCQSKFNLSQTNRVDIKTLMENADESLDGRFFLCRCITPPCKSTAVKTVVDDPEGKRAVRLALYNYTSAGMTNVEQVLPVGLILAIKNPWFKSTMDGGFAVRCDNPADVIIVNSETLAKSFPNLVWKGEIPTKYRSRTSPGASGDGSRRNVDGGGNSDVVLQELSNEDKIKVEHFKRTGNQSFIDKHFVDAIRFYTQALEISPMNIDLLSNRAASFINLGCYNKAMLDIGKVLDQDPFHIKGIYRQVRSLWGLQRYKEAVDFVNTKFGQNSALEKVKELRLLNQKTLEMQVQHETGNFDMVEIIKDPTKTPEIAEFTGPVQISKVPGKGRGLIATEVIKPGQLLLCSKAFAFHSLDSNTDKASSSFSFNLDTKALSSPGHDDIVTAIVQKLSLEPELGREFFQLFAGPDLEAFSENEKAIEEVDMKRIDRIVTFNAFSVGYLKPTSTSISRSGVWIMASYCNHSCVDANAYWETFGTFMFIRAVQTIQKGEEIVISYMSQHLDYNRRKGVFRTYAFKCACLRCNLEREEGKDVRRLRSDIIASLESKNLTSVSELTSALEEFSKLESLQKKLPKMNLSLAHPVVLDIGLQLFEMGDYERCVALFKKAHFVSKDTTLARHAVSLSSNILACHLADQSTPNKVAKKWVKKVNHDLLVAFGFGSSKPNYFLDPKMLKLLQSACGLEIVFPGVKTHHPDTATLK